MITAKIHSQNYTTEIRTKEHSFKADEPISIGGMNKGPTPIDILCSSLASCMLITLKMYINHKKWPIDTIEAQVDYKINPIDKSPIFDVVVSINADIDILQEKRLLKIAHACPVHKILEKGNLINIDLLNLFLFNNRKKI
jgi:putative redox protein